MDTRIIKNSLERRQLETEAVSPLFVCDGSDLNIACNPKDTDTYFQSLPADKGFDQFYMNMLYDLCGKRYTDVVIQPVRKEKERYYLIRAKDGGEGSMTGNFMLYISGW